jgi:hypothetical protein
VSHKLEARLIQQMLNIDLSTSKKVIDGDHVVAFSQQSITQMRAQKAGTAGDENAHKWG